MVTLDRSSSPPLGQLDAPFWIKPLGAGGRSMLDLLLKRGPQSQASLSRLLGLSQPSIARLVSGFQSDGMLQASARTATGRGNPSVMLSLEPDYAFGLGVALVGDALSMAIIDFSGKVRAVRSLAMPDMSRAAVVPRLVELKADLIQKTKINASRIVGAGVGFSGFLVGSPPRFNPAGRLTDWFDADVADTISSALDLPAICDNDGTAAAIAESLLGVGRTCATFAYCHLTNGFGGGLVAEGRVIRGALGNAGDFGGVWWILNEGYPNLDRLRFHVEATGRHFDTIEEMVHSVDPDTPGVEAWISEAIGPFAKLSFLLGHMIAPEKVVIGGRLPGWLAQKLADRVALPSTPDRNGMPFPLPEVVAREVEGDSVAMGAAIMPLQALFLA